MKLRKILGVLLVLVAIFVFVGCGDKGTILLQNDFNNTIYEGYSINLTCTYSDLSTWDEVQTISVHNKTTGETISSVEQKPCEFSGYIQINTDFSWVPDGEKEKVYEFYVQMGDKVSNTVSINIRHAKELLCEPENFGLYLEDVLAASYNDRVYSIPFDYISFRVYKHIPWHLTDEESDLQENALVNRYLKLEADSDFVKTEVNLVSWKDSLSNLFDESKIGSRYQIYYEYPKENIKTDIVTFELTEGVF